MYEDMRAFPFPDESVPLYISLAGTSYCDGTYRIVRNHSYYAVIEYVLSGAGFIRIDNSYHRVEADTIYFLPMGMNQEYYADPEDPYTKIFMNISGPLCQQLTDSYRLSNLYFFNGSGLKEVFQEIPALIHTCHSDEELQGKLQGLFTQILYRLFCLQANVGHTNEAVQLKEYLDSQTHRLVHTKEFCQVIYRSADYCQKLFLREFGITPYQYQLERKMQIAKSLLRYSKKQVCEIAASLGYSDAQYFSNLFQKKCGMRPLKYRNQEHPQ